MLVESSTTLWKATKKISVRNNTATAAEYRMAGMDPDTDYPQTWDKMIAVSERIAFRHGGTPLRAALGAISAVYRILLQNRDYPIIPYRVALADLATQV